MTEKVKKTRAPKKLPVDALKAHAQNLSIEDKIALRDHLNGSINVDKEKLQKQLELINGEKK